MTITLYGITNCHTVKKARAWMRERGVAYQFHDFKQSGVPLNRIDVWLETLGWERLLNRQGNTWRKLDETRRSQVVDSTTARQLMLEHPSVIKRPVVEWHDKRITVGYDAADWARR